MTKYFSCEEVYTAVFIQIIAFYFFFLRIRTSYLRLSTATLRKHAILSSKFKACHSLPKTNLTVCIALTPRNDWGLHKLDIEDFARIEDQNLVGTIILDLCGDLPVWIMFHFVKKLQSQGHIQSKLSYLIQRNIEYFSRTKFKFEFKRKKINSGCLQSLFSRQLGFLPREGHRLLCLSIADNSFLISSVSHEEKIIVNCWKKSKGLRISP